MHTGQCLVEKSLLFFMWKLLKRILLKCVYMCIGSETHSRLLCCLLVIIIKFMKYHSAPKKKKKKNVDETPTKQALLIKL